MSSKEELEKLTVTKLKEILKEKGLSCSGSKKDLIERILTPEGESKKRKAESSETKSSKKSKKEEVEHDEEVDEGKEEDGGKIPLQKEDTKVPYGAIPNKVKIVSFNVNGFNSAYKKGLKEYVEKEQPHILCLQETKLSDNQTKSHDGAFGESYTAYWNCCLTQKNYAGTAIFTKIQPKNVIKGINVDEHDKEGRVLTLEFDEFYLVNAYVPNSGMKLDRLNYRKTWDKSMLHFLKELEKTKPVIWTGDLNVSHNEIDLALPKKRRNKVPGFCDSEREGFSNILESGFIDVFRKRNPDTVNYTYWGYKFQSRQKNLGWRLDYWVVSKSFYDKIGDDFIRGDQWKASDHVPLGILLDDWTKKDKKE